MPRHPLTVGAAGDHVNIRILGLGNVLMSDDALGPYVARVLNAFYEFPAGVEVIDVGTPGLDLTPYLDAETVILVDTVRAGKAGEVRTYDRDDILRDVPQPRVSPYDPGLKEALQAIAATGGGPAEVVLLGVSPLVISPGVELSDQVRAAVTPLIARVVAELERRGFAPRPRPVPRRPDTWWEEVGETAFAER
jgi:hydrogenase maturation protease